MPFILRAIRKNRWLDYDKPERPHLSDEDIKMGPLADLRVDDNSQLSVWRITDDRSNFRRVVAALAANRDYPANLDYILLDQQVLSDRSYAVDDRT